MPYMLKQKLNLSDLVALELRPKSILLLEPDQYLRSLYSLYLKRHDFGVEIVLKAESLSSAIAFLNPHALVFSTHYYPKAENSAKTLLSIRTQFPRLPIVTIGLVHDHEQLKKFIAAGITSHIDRKLTRPQDLAVVIRTLLQ